MNWDPSDELFSQCWPGSFHQDPSWVLPPALPLPVPAPGCSPLSPSPPHVFSYRASLAPLSFCPSRPICYLPAGSALRCTAVGRVRIRAEWVTHSQSAAPKPRGRPPRPRDPAAARGRARLCTDAHSHARLHTACPFLWGRNAGSGFMCTHINTELNLNGPMI